MPEYYFNPDLSFSRSHWQAGDIAAMLIKMTFHNTFYPDHLKEYDATSLYL
jgi:hypothetical protein